MKLENIKTPDDVLNFMISNIKYGWLDINDEVHVGNLKNFRKLYRTATVEESLKHGVGTCVEQVLLMKTLLDNINIKSRMFCTRVYEPNDYNDLEAEEHMHCFLLYYQNNKVYQMEHPNGERVGIYEFATEEEAFEKINKYYVEMADGVARPVTEYFEVQPNLSFKEFNNYINSLDNKHKIK